MNIITAIYLLALSNALSENLSKLDTTKILNTNFNLTFNCTNEIIDCNDHGSCIQDKTNCKCDLGWTTYDNPISIRCNYKEKTQLTAFLLQIFLGGVGAADFYVGRIDIGLGKIFLIFGPLILMCIFGICCIENKISQIYIKILYVLASLACFIWWIIDIVNYAKNNIKDENGIQLKEM